MDGLQPVIPRGQPYLPMTNRTVGNPARPQDEVPILMKVTDLMPCREASGGRQNTSNVPDCICNLEHWNYVRQVSESSVETVHRWKIDVCYVRETRGKGSGTKVIGKGVSEYKFFWQGCKESDAGVGILISGKSIDKVDDVKRVNERIVC